MAKDPHHKLALASFVIVAVIALGAFVYIYMNQTGYGFSIAGTRAYVESQIARGQIQVPGGAESVQIVVRPPQTIRCICDKQVFSVSTGEPKGFQKFGGNIPVPYGAIPKEVCKNWCEVEQKARFVCAGNECSLTI